MANRLLLRVLLERLPRADGLTFVEDNEDVEVQGYALIVWNGLIPKVLLVKSRKLS